MPSANQRTLLLLFVIEKEELLKQVVMNDSAVDENPEPIVEKGNVCPIMLKSVAVLPTAWNKQFLNVNELHLKIYKTKFWWSREGLAKTVSEITDKYTYMCTSGSYP